MVNKNNQLRDSRHLEKYFPYVDFYRRPTLTDIRHPKTGRVYSTPFFWRVALKPDGSAPDSGDEGELWYLVDITANVANWVLFSENFTDLSDLRDQDNVAIGPSASGTIDLDGLIVANATNPVPLKTQKSATANTMDFELQVAADRTGAPANKNDAGIASFDDTQFIVDANGYVTLVGGAGLPVVQTLTSDDPTAVGPDGSGNINVTGEAVANATNAKPVYVDAGTHALNIEVQVATAVTGAPGDKNDAGLASFDDNHFVVNSDGYTSLKGAAGLFWVEEITTSRNLLVNQGVVGTNAGTITMTLPATAAFGDVIRVTQKGAGLVRIAQNAGQTIHFGNASSTTGAGGYIQSTVAYDAVELLCITANTDFQVLSSVGVWSVV